MGTEGKNRVAEVESNYFIDLSIIITTASDFVRRVQHRKELMLRDRNNRECNDTTEGDQAANPNF
jgi:hypothetical protein